MDTTTIICDTIVVKLNEVAGIDQAIVTEPGTNWQDVIIWVTLFLSVAYVVRFFIKRYFEKMVADEETIEKTKGYKEDMELKIREDKVNAELQQCKNEIHVQARKRKVELQDQLLKRKLELQEKLLNYIKDYAREKNSDNNGINQKPVETYTDAYVKQLQEAINETDKLFNDFIVDNGKEA